MPLANADGIFVFKGNLHDKTDVLLSHVTPGASVIWCSFVLPARVSGLFTVATLEGALQFAQSL